jgi:pimeloyl-ACP methyl ester carboxylesterase
MWGTWSARSQSVTSPVAERLEPRPFEVLSGAVALAGEEVGEGSPVVLLHGLTATRRYVLHGSVALARSGHTLISYDARGHGESSPAAAGEGYGYPELVQDLRAVIGERCRGERPVLAGHSMGCHTAAAHALERPDEVAALVLAGPVTLGIPASDETLGAWDRLADGLERGGVDGFMKAYEADLQADPAWTETALRITRERMKLHRHPDAVVQALRQVPRSLPFDGMRELETLDVPALVVASYDEADPSHPYSIAEEWADRLPSARLVSEEPGKSPLAWQGGRLSRVIADFLDEPQVAERMG